MSKYENSVFPYSVHSTVNYSTLGRKTYYFRPLLRRFTETSPPKRKVFFQNYMKNVAKTDEFREVLSTSHFVT